jgi:L-histidine N-alpha-methyltransferase
MGERLTITGLGGGGAEDVARDVCEGLSSKPKDLSPWPKYLYDAEGSRIFEEITHQPEYYQTRAELGILRQRSAEIFTRTGCGELVEPGSGAASKTRALLDAMSAEARYVPLDVSQSALEESALRLLAEYPTLEISGYVGDFNEDLDEFLRDGSSGCGRLVAFLGGTIGNFTPASRREFLSRLASGLGDGDYLLIGVDLVKDRATLEAAYNDAAGVTERFEKNLLTVINREVGADFDPDLFFHRAFYNPKEERMEMWLFSRAKQDVRVDDISVHFEAGEGVRAEISTKFTPESARRALEEARLDLIELYIDEHDYFGLALCEPE